MSFSRMRLLAKDRLVKTGPVDHADWNYRFLLGAIQRSRFSLALSLLGHRSKRLLEVGFGSGVFMPSLSAVADQLFGIDVHDEAANVRSTLTRDGVKAELICSPAETIPFASNSFDTVVAVSSLEFVTDLQKVCLEVRRVLEPSGTFIVITPGNSPIVDAGLKILTGLSAQKDFGDRRKLIVPTLRQHFRVDKCYCVPPVGHQIVCLYHGFRLTALK